MWVGLIQYIKGLNRKKKQVKEDSLCLPYSVQAEYRPSESYPPYKDFAVINKAEVGVFLELSSFFYDPPNVGNFISGSFAFSKSSLNIWKFMVHVLLKPGLEIFEHYFASVWDAVWKFFGIAFIWDWNENWPFPVLWPLLSFPNLLAYWVQHFKSIIF